MTEWGRKMAERYEIVKFKLRKTQAGAITLTDISGNYSNGFNTPDNDGKRFIEFMKNVREDDIILIMGIQLRGKE